MNKISVLIVLIFFKSIVLGQTPKAAHLSDSLLKRGTFKAAITTYEFPDEIKKLQNKALKALADNPEWSDKFTVDLVKSGDKKLKFHDALGLTRQEFDLMINGFNKGKRAVYTDSSQISITKFNNLITFKAPKRIDLLNYVKINTKNNMVYFDKVKLTSEVEIYGKSYAPILKGIECHRLDDFLPESHPSGITDFAFTIGTNDGNTKPTICLLYAKPVKGQEFPKVNFLVITFL